MRPIFLSFCHIFQQYFDYFLILALRVKSLALVLILSIGLCMALRAKCFTAALPPYLSLGSP